MLASSIEKLVNLYNYDNVERKPTGNWSGDVGKCWVETEGQNKGITIVGWLAQNGTIYNNFRLVVEPGKRGKKEWVRVTGFDDVGKSIDLKVPNITMAQALENMLAASAEDNQPQNVGILARVIQDVDYAY